jgi:putative FmdB family regulatory protein
MPLYEYRCESCQHQFEVIRKFSDAPLDVCPNCGAGPVVKLLSSPAFQFKGTGWYITDYARKDSAKADAAKSESAKTEGAKSEPSKSESKSETTSKESSTTATSSATPKSDS